jgi:ribose/xylose/arabinose/galactoside ABC-type transport system permease subunit
MGWKKHNLSPTKLLLITLVLIYAIFTFTVPEYRFLSTSFIQLLFELMPIFIFLVIGQSLVILTGEIDISVGQVFVFCSTFLSLLYTVYHLHPALAIIGTLLLGCSAGALNGFLVTRFKLNSFLVTLATTWIFYGIMLLLSGAYSIPYSPNDRIYVDMFIDRIGGIIPTQLIWAIIFSTLFYIILSKTRLGNWMYATGSNPEAAFRSGINIDYVKMIAFIFCGFLAAFAGIIDVSRFGAGLPRDGGTSSLVAVAGAAIGGIRLGGGSGSLVGAILGAIIMRILDSGFVMMNVPPFYFQVILGITILIAVIAHYKFLKER